MPTLPPFWELNDRTNRKSKQIPPKCLSNRHWPLNTLWTCLLVQNKINPISLTPCSQRFGTSWAVSALFWCRYLVPQSQNCSFTVSAMAAAQTEMSLIPNGRSHDPGEEADVQDQWVSATTVTHTLLRAWLHRPLLFSLPSYQINWLNYIFFPNNNDQT